MRLVTADARRYAANQEAYKARARTNRYRRLYGITVEQYDAMFKLQNGVCAICLDPPKPGRRLHVDHDHRTKRVRGLLDFKCNRRLLGRGREIPERHLRAAAYLSSNFDGRSV